MSVYLLLLLHVKEMCKGMMEERAGDEGEKEPDSENPVGGQEATLRIYTKKKIMRCSRDELFISMLEVHQLIC